MNIILITDDSTTLIKGYDCVSVFKGKNFRLCFYISDGTTLSCYFENEEQAKKFKEKLDYDMWWQRKNPNIIIDLTELKYKEFMKNVQLRKHA